MAEDGDFKTIQSSVFSALVNTTRTATQIGSEDLAFYRSSNQSVGPLLDKQSSRLLSVAKNLIKISTSETELTAPQLRDVDSVEDNWRGVVDVIDHLLEKADASLDEYTGVIKKLSFSQEEQTSKNAVPARRQPLSKNFRAQDIPKPQLSFKRIPRNDEITPFKPLLRSKPHSLKPLDESLRLSGTENGPDQYEHPYQLEIMDSVYPTTVYTKSDPIPYLPFQTTQATFVDTPELVNEMLQELKQASEIAVDLEHHDAHSFVGLVSLMQISTRKKDWIIDTLKPWREDLQILNEVFADPKIVKVLHGAYMDMIWLQRDLGLYVVGLFDTFHASRCLGYPRNSLAALLKRFVDFDADKQYQTADWRIRPLPQEMFNYARSDTHFLLFIYDNMRNELLENSNKSLPNGDLIQEVLKRSKEEALQRYERSLYDEKLGQGPGGWYNMLLRAPSQLSKEQFAVFRAVHHWRDRVARTEDEGIVQVMSKQVLYDVARNIPGDIPSLLRRWHPLSVTLRSRAAELLGVIQQAKLAGATGPEMKEIMNSIQSSHTINQREATKPSIVQLRSTKGKITLPLAAVNPGSLSLRTHKSQFWGSMLEDGSRTLEKEMAQTQLSRISLAIPLPELTAEIFKTDISADISPQAPKKIDPGARAEHQYVKERNPKHDDIFVIKQLGAARKRKASEMQETTEPALLQTSSERILIDGRNDRDGSPKPFETPSKGLTSQPMNKKALKKQRKLERRVAFLEKQRNLGNGEVQSTNRGSEMVETTAFDYSNAPSMLHPKRDKSDRAGSRKAFDPYVKSLNAPKGMPKSKKGFGGRSLTFQK